MTHVYLLETSGAVVQNFLRFDDAVAAGCVLGQRYPYARAPVYARLVWHAEEADGPWNLVLEAPGDKITKTIWTTVWVRRYDLRDLTEPRRPDVSRILKYRPDLAVTDPLFDLPPSLRSASLETGYVLGAGLASFTTVLVVGLSLVDLFVR